MFGTKQLYTLTDITNNMNERKVLVWSAVCSDCDTPFETTSGMAGKGLVRRCTTHRRKVGKPTKNTTVSPPEAKVLAWIAAQKEGPQKRANTRFFAKYGYRGEKMTAKQRGEYRAMLEQEQAIEKLS